MTVVLGASRDLAGISTRPLVTATRAIEIENMGIILQQRGRKEQSMIIPLETEFERLFRAVSEKERMVNRRLKKQMLKIKRGLLLLRMEQKGKPNPFSRGR